MLIEFRAENHRSLLDEQVLSMEAASNKTDDESRSRKVDGHSKRLLPVAAIYGANASGKSNVLSALAFMKEAVFDSHRVWEPEEGVPRDPFAWGKMNKEPSFYEVLIVVDSVRYQYGFTLSDERVLEEWLYAWPKNRKQKWFTRDEDEFVFGEHFRGENKLIESVTRPNALFLSTAAQHRHLQLQPILAWFRRLTSMTSRGHEVGKLRPYIHPAGGLSHLLVLQKSKIGRSVSEWMSGDLILDNIYYLLQYADVGIVDIKIDANNLDQPNNILFRHQGSSADVWLALNQESKGTQTLIKVAFDIVVAILEGGTLLFDELEASLHPSLARKIVQIFNDPEKNLSNAQLIFTTHDTNLLGSICGDSVLSRDQVWLTEKDEDGATVLYPLSDYKPRKNENLERGYLQGRYGAIPFLGNFKINED